MRKHPNVRFSLGAWSVWARWLVHRGWSVLRPGKRLLSVLLLVSLVVPGLVVLSASAPALGLNWSSLVWQPEPTPIHLSVAERVQAFYQGDPTVGWDTRQQYETWWPSACSPAALTMDLHAWGVRVPIGQVLDRLIALEAITPHDGLLRAEALATVARGYGFHAKTVGHWTAQQVAQVTAQGVPVLLDLRDAQQQTPYPGLIVGHWLVAVSVSPAGGVEVRDSSGYRIRQLTPRLFQILFTGKAVVVWQGEVTVPRA